MWKWLETEIKFPTDEPYDLFDAYANLVLMIGFGILGLTIAIVAVATSTDKGGTFAAALYLAIFLSTGGVFLGRFIGVMIIKIRRYRRRK